MSLAQPQNSGGQRSPGLNLNLASNNPFRNRGTTSPSLSADQASPRERPVSRNPFLDPATNDYFTQQRSASASGNMSAPTGSEPTKLKGYAAELFDNLTLEDRPPQNNERRPSVNAESASRPPRGPPPPKPGTHKPSRSQEEAMRARKPGAGSSSSRPRPQKEELDIFADPSDIKKSESRKPRRNSESSIMERKPLDPEEEKKRHERRRRERREREMREKGPKKPNRKLDVIDKLDLSSIYGTGLFHHDGPFDACNPHRNRQGSKRAPMQAFPEGSLNNALGGNTFPKRVDHSTFMGNNDDEAFRDYGVAAPSASRGRNTEPNIINFTSRVEPVHGDETLGLGTSTFLEGTPASRTAIKQLETEQLQREQQLNAGGGLSRKKSLAQKIRGVSAPRRDFSNGRMNSSEAAYSPSSPPLPTSASARSAGAGDGNPFDFDFGNESRSRKKGSFSNANGEGRGFPGERLERRATEDNFTNGDQASKAAGSGGGFLSRVKSLKGPRKPRATPAEPQAL